MLVEGRALDRNVVSEELGVRPANADRHLRAIRTKMNVHITQQRGRTVTQLERRGSEAPLANATIAAACIAGSLAQLFSRTPLEKRMRDAVLRLVDSARDQLRFNERDRKFLFIARGGERALTSKGSARLDSVLDAIVEQRKLRIRHQRFDGSSTLTYICPVSLALYEHQLYLIGFVGQELVNIRFSRISAALKLRDKFDYPSLSQYNPSKVFYDSLGIFIKDEPSSGITVQRVRIRLDKRWLPYVRSHRWHHSQKHYTKGEAIILELRLRTCRELDRLILGFGPDAEVLSPPDLRERIAQQVNALAEHYTRK